MRNLVLISHLEAIKTYFHAFKGYIDDRYSNDYNRFAGVDNQSFIGRKTILEFIFYLVLILFFTKIAGDISVHITSAMDIVGSVTFNLDSQLRILGTTNHPASIATRKNINFLPINKPNDISSPVPKKLSITANIITTRTSSTTAAPRMVLPSREFSLFISFRTCTVILTEVALRRTPIKREYSILKPNNSPTPKPPRKGKRIPRTATAKADFQFFFNCSRSVSRPAINISNKTPIPEK